jgi:hypothetical protein
MIVDLINMGPRIRCSRSGRPDYKIDMNPDGKGGWVSKKNDVFIKPWQRSQYTEGSNWWRGIK